MVLAKFCQGNFYSQELKQPNVYTPPPKLQSLTTKGAALQKQVSFKASNNEVVRLSKRLKNLGHGILKARRPRVPLESRMGDEFQPMWHGTKLALLSLTNQCYLSVTKDGRALADCSLSSPGIPPPPKNTTTVGG